MDAAAVSSGYTTDIVYPSAFGVFQAPIHLAYAASLGGRAAPRLDGAAFTYCDLGTGAGLTLCVLADCYPEAQFHGVDINPEHVRRGRALAEAAGLSNVTFHEAGFADLGRLSLPALDFVAMGGVYSWIAPELRAACLSFARDRLTERGAVFVHYGALPGNSQIDALYALLRETAAGIEGDSLTRFAEACRIVEGLRAAKARFFQYNPFAAAWMDQVAGQDPRAMAHEVLNAQRASLWAADVAAEARAAGLSYVANAQLELNDLGLCAPPDMREALARLAPAAREMALDTLRNANSRMDVLMRADAPAEAAPPSLWLDRMTRGPLAAERQALGRRARLDLSDPLYADILAETEHGAARLPQLLAAPGLEGREGLRLAVERLIALKLVNVLRRPYAPVRPGAGDLSMPSRLNRLVLEGQVEAAGALPFASPVAGTQVLLPLEDRLALLAMLGGDLSAAWERLRASGRTLKHEGKAVASAADLAAAAQARAAAIGEPMTTQLQGLGVLA
ncbi:class I SAM-dependent methyltransferase [Phenylobacterium sp.]|jgi:cyclopropane fatty-acyl-phospholipid synthase-like methyltransferase|uniref:class I SAM-dependent methyltransferase n=1 Tax=Phenylobacterium sp. TaxID=1871053 RepID=UPI002F3F830F